jgi:hypothetical protein
MKDDPAGACLSGSSQDRVRWRQDGGGVSMTTSQVVGRRKESTVTATPVDDSLESELFFSDREAGVACFVDADDEVDEDA